MRLPNRIQITREIEGFTIHAYARYIPSVDGWECTVKSHFGGTETRTPDQTGNDAFATLIDMIDLTLQEDRKIHERNCFK